MKITKRQLKRIIKEEKSKLLQEQIWGQSSQTGSDLIEFAKAYAGLGNAVQEQFDSLVSGWIENRYARELGSDRFSDIVFEQNPNAIDTIEQRLTPSLKRIVQAESEDAEILLGAIKEAQRIFGQGDSVYDYDVDATEEMDEGEY